MASKLYTDIATWFEDNTGATVTADGLFETFQGSINHKQLTPPRRQVNTCLQRLRKQDRIESFASDNILEGTTRLYKSK